MTSAIPELKRRLVLSPDDAEARARLGEALLQAGDAEGAAKQLLRASQLDPDGALVPGVWLLLGRALEQSGRLGGAAHALREHLRRRPDDLAAQDSVAELLHMAGFLDEALLHAEQAARLALHAGDGAGKVLRAVEICQRKGLSERALLHVQHGLRRLPGEPRLIAALRELYTDLGDEEAVARLGGRRPRRALLRQAQEDISAALPVFERLGGAVLTSARLLAAGDTGGLRQALAHAAPRDPEEDVLTGYLRAELALLDGDEAQAERLWQKVLAWVEHEPGSADMARLLPAVLSRLADAAKARADLRAAADGYRRALRLRPDAGRYADLGDVLLLLGERDEATHAHEAARHLDGRLPAGRGGDDWLSPAEWDGADPIGAALRLRQRGPEVGRILVLGVCLRMPRPEDREEGEPVPLFGVVNELQAVTFPGRGEVACTGLVGPELLDEARTAAAFVKAQAARLGLSGLPGIWDRDVHLHFVRPRNEGRSGGLGQVLALVSACTGRPVRGGLSASGSVTPLGEVHRVDGVREKLLAAYHAGVHAVMLPRACLRQVREAPAEVLDRLEILYVDSALEACALALLPPGGDP